VSNKIKRLFESLQRLRRKVIQEDNQETGQEISPSEFYTQEAKKELDTRAKGFLTMSKRALKEFMQDPDTTDPDTYGLGSVLAQHDDPELWKVWASRPWALEWIAADSLVDYHGGGPIGIGETGISALIPEPIKKEAVRKNKLKFIEILKDAVIPTIHVARFDLKEVGVPDELADKLKAYAQHHEGGWVDLKDPRFVSITRIDSATRAKYKIPGSIKSFFDFLLEWIFSKVQKL